MSDQEKVPEGEVFSVRIAWTLAEMEQARDFEALIDARINSVKEQIMQAYWDRRPPPFDLPQEE